MPRPGQQVCRRFLRTCVTFELRLGIHNLGDIFVFVIVVWKFALLNKGETGTIPFEL